MYKLVLLLFWLTTLPLSYATNVDFDIDSDGSIYACDAGIRHKTHSDRICYNRETEKTCDPSLCPSEANCNCVCSGGTTSNDQEGTDMIQLLYKNWTEKPNPSASTTPTVVIANGESFKRIFPGRTEWDRQITQLSFNLGSERYGTEYYIDICYRGPMVEFWDLFKNFNGPAKKFPNFSIKLQATLTDLSVATQNKYSQLAGLNVKMTATCDVQGEGQYKYAQASGQNNGQSHQITDVSGGDKNFFTNYSTFGSGGNLVFLNDEWINYGNGKTPRFCKIRYSFIENIRNSSASQQSQIRKRDSQKSRISTFSEIELDDKK